MKNNLLLLLCTLMAIPMLYSQETTDNAKKKQGIHTLIDTYARAREKKDSTVLEQILVSDVDQLVSSGKWRRGKKESLNGMLQSSASNPGTRTLKIEHIRFLGSENAIVDARYQIQNTDGTLRKMWSTFVVVYKEDRWKIAAIRNMLPARPQ